MLMFTCAVIIKKITETKLCNISVMRNSNKLELNNYLWKFEGEKYFQISDEISATNL